MKFTHQIKFNSVPDWARHYNHMPPSYDCVEANEASLKRSLDKELASVNAFYLSKEAETLSKLASLDLDVHSIEPRHLGPHRSGSIDIQSIQAQSSPNRDLERSLSGPTEGWPRTRILEKERLKQSFYDLFLNLTNPVRLRLALTPTPLLNTAGGSVGQVERNTVWRDMVALERTKISAKVDHAVPEREYNWLTSMIRANWPIALSCLVFAILLDQDVFRVVNQVYPEVLAHVARIWLNASMFYSGDEAKQNCLAMLAFVSLLWATEAIPLFSTSMLVPPLVVILRVLMDNTVDPPTRMTPQQAAGAIFHAMFSQHFIAKQLAIAVLSRVGRKPHNVLLACMFVATFASMWISNVAAPVLCFSLVQPILRTLDTTNNFAKCLVMGIALASNIGGMTSPISSPQNIFAIERMSMDGNPPSWLAWFAVSIPVSVVCVFVCWGIILVAYKPWLAVTEVRPLKPNTDPMNMTQFYVIFISLATVVLWCCNTSMQK
eukprot:gene24060-9634_t